MLISSEVYNRIESSGIYGIRRVDLRKEFGKDVDNHVNELISQGLVFVDKKNGAITYWSKDSYLRYMLEKDPKLKLLQELIRDSKDKEEVIDNVELEEKIKDIVENVVNEKINIFISILNSEILKIKDLISNMNSNYSSLNDYISSIKSELETRFSLMHNKLISYIDENISIINSRLLDNNKELNERINMLDTQVRSIINLNDMIKENREELDIKIKEEISSLKAYVDAKSDSINMMLNEQRSFSNDIVKRLTTLEESIRDLEARIHKVNQHLDNVINNNNELREEISSISKSIDSNIDTKISLAIDKIHTKINNLTEDLANIKQELDTKLIYIDEVVRRVDDILATLKASTNGKNGNGTYNNENVITLEQFRIDFDRMLAESSSSIGWVELASIRERMCRRYNISAHEFYTLVSQLIEHFNSRYELSSGGQEGIVIRGLIHGFVRRV
jgi:flagellar capping protein FliD